MSRWEGALGHFLPRPLTPCCVPEHVPICIKCHVPCAGFWKMGWWVNIKERLHESAPRKGLINELNPHKALKSTRLHILTAGKALVNSHTDHRNPPHNTHGCRNQVSSVPHITKLLITSCASQDLLSPGPRPLLRVDLGVMNPQLPFLPLPRRQGGLISIQVI